MTYPEHASPLEACGDKNTKPFTAEERQQFKLFDKPVAKLIDQTMHPDPDAEKIGNCILQGEEGPVGYALRAIAEKTKLNPNFLKFPVIATDPLGRKVRGTLLQIAAMAGDVDLQDDIKDEKQRCSIVIIVRNASESEKRSYSKFKQTLRNPGYNTAQLYKINKRGYTHGQ